MTQDQLISLAVQHHDAGRFTDAETVLRQLLTDRPNDPMILTSLGDVLTDAKKFDQAEPIYQQVIDAAPDAAAAAGAYDGLAAIYQDRGDIDRAVPASKKAARLRGNADDAYAVGLVLENMGRGDDAVEMFQLAAELRPEFAEAHHKFAGHLRIRGKTDEAVRHYKLAAQARPTVAEFHCNLANALRLAGREDEALASVRHAIDLKPGLAEAHNVLGTIWKDRRRPSDAIGSFARAMQLKPNYAEAMNNMGAVIEQAGKIDEAGDLFEKAVAASPQTPEFHENFGHNLLLRGEFDRGWHEMDWRRGSQMNPAGRRFPRPIWEGFDLHGRTILLHAEQGLGDTIQFLRFAALVRDRGGRVVLECQPQLTALAAKIDGVAEVIPHGDALPPFDVHYPLMSLPIVFRISAESIPAKVPYITADPEKIAAWGTKLSGVQGKRVGLVWGGNPKFRNDKTRSCPPAKLALLSALPGVSLISLQKNAATPAPEKLKLLDLTADLTDFTETAALIANLDLVIAVDTAVAHLAGAMGKLTWVLLPAVPDWRWMLGRDDSPWYSTARLFRQETPGDWTGVASRVAAALATL